MTIEVRNFYLIVCKWYNNTIIDAIVSSEENLSSIIINSYIRTIFVPHGQGHFAIETGSVTGNW